MIVSLIVAMDKNRVIGQSGTLPWNIQADMNFFKTITMHHPVIMGRKTHESIGRALPHRLNIIVTRQAGYQPKGKAGDSVIVPNLEAAFDWALKVEKQEIFVIGGAEIFEQAMPVADKIYITEIDSEFKGDTFFPEISSKEWELKSSSALNNESTGGHTLHFKTYERRK
ncbi:MAG: dihydrofolate reductase [Candidatus Paceibacterota bacterium]|jgi:dihydrofolate reductase